MYEVPESKKSVGQDKFDFKIGKKAHQVTKAKYLTGAQLEDVTSGDLSRIFDTFGAKTTAVGQAVRGLEYEQIIDLVNAWMADSELNAGKSSAS